ncbi:MAG: MiaB-like tRNA modifying enzyme, archaeal-type [uncultured archaeon A07HB70]|nr:MAG: MiaB-like tRNA modifying enzyme, archaeal-type [uncultured archaeon A07HB70]
MASYHIETYGCTANRGESTTIERRLRDAGHHPVDGPTAADVAILNTCTVVEKTERNMRRRAEELADETADLIVTGCMALAQGEQFSDLDARVCHWEEVPTAVRNGECPTTTPDSEPVLDGEVGILPLARGCMSDCSYCITKRATGRIESPPVAENVDRARALLHAGATELRLTGQDTGVYGWDINKGESLLPELVDRVCALDPGHEFRVRVGMANPKGLHGVRHELADAFARNDEVYNFLHAPVQSGDDDVLADMRRQHTVDEFRAVVAAFDDALDEWTLATDLIVGFPTEDDDDFARTVDLVREVRPERINVTRFSKRPGTDAAEMKGLGGTLKKERSKALSEVKRELCDEAYDAMVGTERTVQAVQPGTGDSVKCRDDAYRQVVVQNASEWGVDPGDRLSVEVTEARTVYALGRPC